MNISPFLSINHPCEETLRWSKEQLAQAGLRPVQTFDLHAARSALHDCPCPNHGTQECDCQMVVLLVYGNAGEPTTLILHGNDGQTWLSLAEPLRSKSETTLSVEIKQALDGKVSDHLEK